jgi:quercetin dioxygenase-like cupin family protein
MSAQPPRTQTRSELPAAERVRVADLVNYQEGAVVSRTLLKRATGTVTLFAFDVDQGLSEHTSSFDALVQVLEGQAEVTVAGNPNPTL